MSTAPNAASPVRSRRVPRALFAGALLCGLSCALPEPGPPDADWPAGALLSAERAPLLRVLSQLEQLERTPLARLADALRRALPDCDAIEARADGPAGLGEAIRCADASGAMQGLHDYRGESGVALAIPLDAGPRLLLRAEPGADRLRLELHWPEASLGDGLAGLLPGSDEAGPALLAGGDRVLHARVRSRGLDLEALVPEGSQGDQLFHLRSGLLSRALLDGTWELALYAPTEQARMPRVALALGVRLRSAAETAVDRLLDELEAGWSLRRAPLPWPGANGACLPDLKLIPELAPCVLTTDRAVVLGWNAASLQHALGVASSPTPMPGAGRVELDLARLRRADLQLAALHGDEALAQVTRWPWRRAVARGERRGGALALSIELEHASGGAGS